MYMDIKIYGWMDGGVPLSNTVPLGRPFARLYRTTQPMRTAHVPLPGRSPPRGTGKMIVSQPCAEHTRFCRRPQYPAYHLPIAAPGVVLFGLSHPGTPGQLRVPRHTSHSGSWVATWQQPAVLDSRPSPRAFGQAPCEPI